MRNKLLFIVLAATLLTAGRASQAQPQMSLRSAFLAVACAAVVSAYVVRPWAEERAYRGYQRTHLVSASTPISELRGIISAQIGTALATHGHFLTFEDAVAIAVDREKRDGSALRQEHRDWTSFIAQIEGSGFAVQTNPDGQLQIEYPHYPRDRKSIFVEALVTIALSNMLHADPPGPRRISVEDLFLYSNPNHSECAPMNVAKLVRP